MAAFVQTAELDWVGTFRYSREDGSPAAAMRGQVTRRESKRRQERLMALQQAVSTRRLRRWIGRTVQVLVEAVNGASATGRTEGQAPEIDGETHLDLRDLPGTRPGDFVLAEVTGSGEYDLNARAQELAHRAPRAAQASELLQLTVLH